MEQFLYFVCPMCVSQQWGRVLNKRTGAHHVIEQSGVLEAPGLIYNNAPALTISKGRQGREAQNIVKLYLAISVLMVLVATDVLITAYEPIGINPLNESAVTVSAGLAVPAAQVGCLPMAEVFKLALESFKVYDWGLFGV